MPTYYVKVLFNMDLAKSLGVKISSDQLKAADEKKRLQLYINLKLHSSGLPSCKAQDCDNDFFSIQRRLNEA